MYHHHLIVPPYFLDRMHLPDLGADVHPDAHTWLSSVIEGGTERPTRLCAGASIGNCALIGHDAILERDCRVASMSVVGGFSVVGQYARIDLNVTVKPYTMIGMGARIGNGSNVMHDVPAKQLWHGNPARFRSHLCARVGLGWACFAKVAEAGQLCEKHAAAQTDVAAMTAWDVSPGHLTRGGLAHAREQLRTAPPAPPVGHPCQ